MDRASLPSTDPATRSFLAYRAHGDVAALESALLAAAPTIRRVATSLVRAADVDDLVQDCFVVAIRVARGFDERGRLIPWLLGILHNIARSRHRQRWRRIESAESGHAEAIATAPATDLGADLDLGEWFVAFGESLSHLSEPYRSVVRDHLLHGEPLATIAARTGRPAATVRSQFARGLQELRRRLPAPLLAGLVGLTAGRSATAAQPWHLPKPPRRLLAAIAVVTVLATGLAIWSVLAPTTFAAASAGPPDLTPLAVAATPPEPAASDAVAEPPLRRAAPAVTVRLQHPDGTPAAGIAVAFEPNHRIGTTVWRAAPTWRLASTDANGLVQFGIDRHGTASIRVIDTQVLHRFEVGPEPLELTFTVAAVLPLLVRAIDDLDRPIAGAAVIISSEKGQHAPGLHAATTDADGRATVTSALSRYHVWVAAEGHAGTISYSVNAEPSNSRSTPAEAEHLTVRMPRTNQRCRGIVVTRSGRPVARAMVAVWNEANGQMPPRWLLTDRDGRFAYAGLDATAWGASAVADGHAAVSARQLAADADVVLQLSEGGAVVGKLDLLAVSTPSQLRVLARRMSDRRDPLDQGTAVVQPDGRFRIDGLAPGNHAVALFDGGRIHPEQVQATVEEGLDTTVTLSIRPSAPWQIQVEDDLGRPLANCLVRISDATYLLDPDADQQVHTDSRGTARLFAGEPEPVNVFVHLQRGTGHDELPAASRTGVIGENLVVTMARSQLAPAQLRGRLPPVWRHEESARSLVLVAAGCSRRLEVTAEGTFSTDVPAGTFELSLFCEQDGSRWYWLLAKVEVTPGMDLDLGTLPSAELGTAEIALVPGQAAVGPWMSLRSAAGVVLASFQSQRSRPARFRLPEGAYTLVHADHTASLRERSFAVKSNTTARVEVEPLAGRPCRIEVVPRVIRARLGRLLATLRAVDSGAACELVLAPTMDLAKWATEHELVPGQYTLELRVGSRTLHETLIVRPGSDRMVFPFTLR